MFNRIKILFEAWKNRAEIKKNHSKMANVSVVKWVTMAGIQPKKTDFPLPPNLINQVKIRLEWIREFLNLQNLMPESKKHTVMIMDSLGDFTRKDLKSVDSRLNLSLGGTASSFYDAILQQTKTELDKVGVKYLILGCWGNELLSYYDIETVKFHVARTINKARSLYPDAKLIIVGLPPVYDVYVNTVKVEFTNHLINLVSQDANACLVLLEKHFSGAFGIFPKIDYSSDGVHFSGEGIILFDKLLEQAKRTTEKIIGY